VHVEALIDDDICLSVAVSVCLFVANNDD